MNIFFVNPPLREWHFSRTQRSPGVIKSGTMYYPYWLAHAAALVEEHEHQVFLMDCPADGKNRNDLLQKINDFKTDLLVIETSTPSYNYDLSTIEHIKKHADCHVCLVGTHSTVEWEDALNRCQDCDFVAIGEYDFTILDLANSLEQGKDIQSVAGLAYRENHSPQRTDYRPPIEDMDSLPWIAPIYKRFLTIEHYHFTIATHPMVMLISGRGCKAKCFFCVYPQVMHGHAYRTRSPEHVIGEMKWIQENMPEVNEIVFEDDTFTFDRKRAVEIAGLVKKNNITLPWFANIRTNIDQGTLAALKDAGLRECAVGFESADDILLSNMRKGQTLQKEIEFMENCRDLDILVHGCFMVGFPGETKDTLTKTLDLSLKLNPDSAQFYPVMPYPGTGAYQWAKDNGYLATENFDEWLTEDGGHRCVINLPGLPPEELEKFCEHAFRRFHFRPKYMIKKLAQAIRDPKEGIRSISAALMYVFYLTTNKRKTQVGFKTSPVSVDETWGQRVKTPFGRMERQDKAIKIYQESPSDTHKNKILTEESSAKR